MKTNNLFTPPHHPIRLIGWGFAVPTNKNYENTSNHRQYLIHKIMQTNYQSFCARIKSADAGGLKQLEQRIHRFYDLGLLSVSEFGRLDVLIMERLATI
jgi:hypothetical protein